MIDAAITVDTDLDLAAPHTAALSRSIFTQESAIRAESTGSGTGPAPASSPPHRPTSAFDVAVRSSACVRFQRRRPFVEVLRDGQSHYCWPVRVLRSSSDACSCANWVWCAKSVTDWLRPEPKWSG